MDKASSIKSRLNTLFPYITQCKEIIEISKEYVDEYYFENLNLKGSYKKDILDYIKENYNQIYSKYIEMCLASFSTESIAKVGV